jgi:polygalacturonase
MMKKSLLYILILIPVFLFCNSFHSSSDGWERVDTILQQIHSPKFPDQDFFITDFGAVGDGISDCSTAFRLAIDSCHSAGGGRVVVSDGSFLTGPVHLKSNVNLHIEENATILFSRDIEKYLPLVFTRFEGVELMNYSPFVYAFEQENIAITGTGLLDGQADTTVWWPWKGRPEHGWKPGMPDESRDRKALFEMAQNGVPVKERRFGPGHYLRVNFIQLYRCKNILIDGITIKRSPMWEIHPVLCENVTVQNVRLVSHGPNNDGCNPESCRFVLIRNCYFDTGDDCIAIKSGRNHDGRRLGVASEDIVIQNCTMRDGHGGVVIGSEISGDCRNVFAEDCVMDSPNLERALRIKTNSLRGGVVENIYMRNIDVGEVGDAVIRINFHYERGDAGKFTPRVTNIYVNNLSSRKSRYAFYLDGYERSPVSNIRIKDCTFEGVENKNVLNHVEKLSFRNVMINGQEIRR